MERRSSRERAWTSVVVLLVAMGMQGCTLSAPRQISPTTTLPTESQALATELILSDVRVDEPARAVWREFRLASFHTGLEDGATRMGIASTVALEKDVVVRPREQGAWLVRVEMRRAEGGRHAWDRLDAECRVRLYDVSGLTPLSALDPSSGETTIAFDVSALEPRRQLDVPLHLEATVGPRASNTDWDRYEHDLGIELANQLLVGIASGLRDATRSASR